MQLSFFSASVILISLNLTFVESNRLRHVKRRTSTSLSEEISSENGIETEKAENGQISTRGRSQPPEYLNLIYDRLTELDFSTGSTQKYGPILRALFPSQITSGEFGSTFLVFNMSHAKMEKFSSAHLVLTRVGKLDQEDNESYLNVNIQMKNHESILSQRILENERFYTFDITTLMREVANTTGAEITRFDLECDVFKNIRRKKIWFNEVFSTATEKPLVLFAYLKNDHSHESGRIRRQVELEPVLSTLSPSPTEESISDDTTGKSLNNLHEDDMDNTIQAIPIPISIPATTPSRSSSSALKSMCRRYEWFVSPHEIGLYNVLKPDKIDLGYCAGSCPYPLLNGYFNFTIHSFFLDQYRLGRGFDLPKSFPASNCVPVSYRQAVVMEYETDGGFIFRTFTDASVGSCGCR